MPKNYDYLHRTTANGGGEITQAKPLHVLFQGYDGAVPVPVKVDSVGRLILASDVQVEVGDVTIDVGTVLQGAKDASAEPWDMSLSPSSYLDTTHQNVATANGNGTAATVDGYASIRFQVTGTFSATVNFEGTLDGNNWQPLPVLNGLGVMVTSTTSPGIYRADIAGLKQVRARVSGFSSGGVTVISRAVPTPLPILQTVKGDVEATLKGSGEQVAYERALRTTSNQKSLFAPTWARGLQATLTVHGVTGTFAAGEGVSLWVRLLPRSLVQLTNTRQTAAGEIKQVWYPGVSNEGLTPGLANSELKVTGIPPLPGVNLAISITGTFEEGEGIDCELIYQWIM